MDIKRGESITISYVDTVLPTPIRRRRLLKDKRFRCECERCRHRTELERDVMLFQSKQSTTLQSIRFREGAFLPFQLVIGWSKDWPEVE